MKNTMYVMIGLMVVGILGGAAYQQREDRLREERVLQVQSSLQEIQRQALFRGSVGTAPKSPRGFAMRLDPEWVGFHRFNPLLSGERPWVEVASIDEKLHEEPRRITGDKGEAGFWYNPYQGVVRARVPMQISIEATVEFYNSVNGAKLTADDVEW